jgi:adenosylhomocysteine nucleosidase
MRLQLAADHECFRSFQREGASTLKILSEQRLTTPELENHCWPASGMTTVTTCDGRPLSRGLKSFCSLEQALQLDGRREARASPYQFASECVSLIFPDFDGAKTHMSYTACANSAVPRHGIRAGLGRLTATLLVLVFSAAFKPASAETGAGDGSRTAILCAYEPEWRALLPSLSERQEAMYAGVTFITGLIEGTPVVLIESGISQVNATVATQAAIDHYKLDGIIVMGISGGINPDLHVGDVVVPAQWREYLDSVFAREQGGRYILPNYFAIPQSEHFGMIFPQPVRIQKPVGGTDLQTWFQTDARLLDAARKASADVVLENCMADHKCLSSTPRVIVGGNGISGPAFVDNAAFRNFTRRVFRAEAVDMEAAAVAHTAYMNKVPFLSIRSLSDLAGGDAGPNEMEAFQGLASQNALAVLRSLLVQVRHAR